MRSRLAAVLICLIVSTASPPSFSQTSSGLPTGPLSIDTEQGQVDFVVELVDKPNDMARGLMFRRSLPADRGMLFDYRRPRHVSMWMKNTFIPLDMLFIDSDGRIVTIAERTVPQTLTSIPSRVPVQAVLEVNSGTVSRHGIKTGDRVIHEIFGNSGG